MKKAKIPYEAKVLNRAAFQVGRRDFTSAELLEDLLARVMGGQPGTCTEFTCNVYAPSPPPPGG